MITLKLISYNYTDLETLAEMFESAYDTLDKYCHDNCRNCPFIKPCTDVSKSLDFIYAKMHEKEISVVTKM